MQIRQINSHQVNNSVMVAFLGFQMIAGKCNSTTDSLHRGYLLSDFGSHLTIATLALPLHECHSMAPKAQGQCLLCLTGCFSHMVLQQCYSLNYDGFLVLSAKKIPRQLPYSKSLRDDASPIQFILKHFKAMVCANRAPAGATPTSKVPVLKEVLPDIPWSSGSTEIGLSLLSH